MLFRSVACQVTDARLIGADKKTNTSYYEVGCQEGMGYAIVAKKDAAPQTFNCLETGQVGADGKESGLKCLLPGNADPKAGLKPYLAKANATCDLERLALSAPATTTRSSKPPVRARRATSSRSRCR